MKKLAVLLPTYNASLYLKESIDSVLNQTFSDFDLYIYDDYSTDDTEAIVLGYDDSRVFYRRNPINYGIAKTLNQGLVDLLPDYEYIARMDADDWCFPERFEKQLFYLDRNTDVVLCGTQGYWLKDLSENPIQGWAYPTDTAYIKCYLLFAATFGHSSVVFRSQSIINFDLSYDETITTCEDWELWVRIAKIGKMANLPDYLMKYRILENSNHRSAEKLKKHFEERAHIIASYWRYFNIPFSDQEIFDLYFGMDAVSIAGFNSKIKKMIAAFNTIFYKMESDLSFIDREYFRYLLARKVLNYWKRSGISRYNPLRWVLVVAQVTFSNKIKFIKSTIR